MSNLDLTPAEFHAVALAVVALCERYYAGQGERPVIQPLSAEAIRGLLDAPLPEEPRSVSETLDLVEKAVFEYSRHHSHARFFGYVASPGAAIAALGDLLASVLNPNVTAWRSAPAPVELEHLTIRWIAEMAGFAPHGLFVSGGSMANFAGLAAARARALPDANEHGLGDAQLRVYASREVHFSITKAAAMLGIGRSNVVLIPTDARLRMDIAALRQAIAADREVGRRPCCLVGSAGTVSTGAVDPLEELAATAAEHELWFHVDGAYGGLAAMARPKLFEGMSRADSLSLDPHKWLYAPVGTGCILYRDPAAARAAFSEHAEYTRVMEQGEAESFAFWDYGPELSRRFRALPVWLLLQLTGRKAIAAAIEENIACAEYFATLVEASPDFELLAPVETSIFCFRYAPRGFEGDLDVLNETILGRITRGGHSYLSNARIGGRFALRGCVLNYRTKRHDMEVLLDDVRAAGRDLITRGPA